MFSSLEGAVNVGSTVMVNAYGSIGEFILARREALGIKQRELARRAGLEAGTVGYWERTRTFGTVPDPEVLKKLAGGLGCSTNELLSAAGYQLDGPLSEVEMEPTDLEARVISDLNRLAQLQPAFASFRNLVMSAFRAWHDSRNAVWNERVSGQG